MQQGMSILVTDEVEECEPLSVNGGGRGAGWVGDFEGKWRVVVGVHVVGWGSMVAWARVGVLCFLGHVLGFYGCLGTCWGSIVAWAGLGVGQSTVAPLCLGCLLAGGGGTVYGL